jgi:hypothetical protein
LLGRTQVELLAGDFIRLTLQFHHLVAQLDALHAEQRGIYQGTLALDPRQYRHQWHLDIRQHTGQARQGAELFVQGQVQAQGHIGIFSSVGAGLLQGNLVEGQLFGAFAGDVLKADGVMLQVLLRQAVHVVPGRGGVQHVGFEHGVEGDAAHGDAVRRVAANGAIGQDVHVELGVLTDLELCSGLPAAA